MDSIINFQDDFEVYPQPNNCQPTSSLLQEPVAQSYCNIQDPTIFDIKIENNPRAFEFSADASLSHRDCSTLDKDSSSAVGMKRSVKRLRPEEDFENMLSNLSEKDKLERNRICARECRKRKKIYVKGLELEIKNLRSELVECRKELSRYKLKEQEKFFSQFNMDMELPENPEPTIVDKQLASSKRLIKKYIVCLRR